MVEGDDLAKLRETLPLGNNASGVAPMPCFGNATSAAVLVRWSMRHEMFGGSCFEQPLGLGLLASSNPLSRLQMKPNVLRTIRRTDPAE